MPAPDIAITRRQIVQTEPFAGEFHENGRGKRVTIPPQPPSIAAAAAPQTAWLPDTPRVTNCPVARQCSAREYPRAQPFHNTRNSLSKGRKRAIRQRQTASHSNTLRPPQILNPTRFPQPAGCRNRQLSPAGDFVEYQHQGPVRVPYVPLRANSIGTRRSLFERVSRGILPSSARRCSGHQPPTDHPACSAASSAARSTPSDRRKSLATAPPDVRYPVAPRKMTRRRPETSNPASARQPVAPTCPVPPFTRKIHHAGKNVHFTEEI